MTKASLSGANCLLVLNVHDHDLIGYGRSETLRWAGFEVIEATTAAEASQHIKTHNLGVIVVDVHVPNSQGLEVVRNVRSDSSLAFIQLVQLCATCRAEPVAGTAAEGDPDYLLSYPPSAEVLVATVTAAARHWRTLQKLKEVSEGLELAKQEREHFAFTVFHDVYEPFRTISRGIELLLARRTNGTLTDDSQMLVDVIEAAVSRLGSVVDGLRPPSRTPYERAEEVETGIGLPICKKVVKSHGG